MFSCHVVGETLSSPIHASGAKETAASWCRRRSLFFFFFSFVVVVNKQSLAFFIIKTLAVGWRVTKPRSFVSATYPYVNVTLSFSQTPYVNMIYFVLLSSEFS